MVASKAELTVPTESTEPTEIVSNPEVTLLVGEGLQRQLGRKTLEGLTLATPMEWHPHLDIEHQLKQIIVGQDAAISATMDVLNRDDFRNPDRPRASVLFVGPVGVGKTTTSKELARILTKDDEESILVDCASFSRGRDIKTLIGTLVVDDPAPHEGEAPIETQAVKQGLPVVIFRNIENGTPQLVDALVQIMSTGYLQHDASGGRVSFKDSVIVMTSDLGAQGIADMLRKKRTGFQQLDEIPLSVTQEYRQSTAAAAVKSFFRPELISLIDRQIAFNPLTDQQMAEVLDRHVAQVNERYVDKASVKLHMSSDLRDSLVASNDDRHMLGVPAILRDYDRAVETKLARYVKAGSIPKGSSVYAVLSDEVDVDADKVKLYYEKNSDLDVPVAAAVKKRASKRLSIVTKENEDHSDLESCA
ncbi:MAG: ATPase domain protein [Candidatus Saccharibacteria bacterium]|nr:ATPase domain protein [Candidatus Saccharibacteria bacterium]